MKAAWEAEENGEKKTWVSGRGQERRKQREGVGRCSSERRQGEQTRNA